jgi:hypothetical protein
MRAGEVRAPTWFKRVIRAPSAFIGLDEANNLIGF